MCQPFDDKKRPLHFEDQCSCMSAFHKILSNLFTCFSSCLNPIWNWCFSSLFSANTQTSRSYRDTRYAHTSYIYILYTCRRSTSCGDCTTNTNAAILYASRNCVLYRHCFPWQICHCPVCSICPCSNWWSCLKRSKAYLRNFHPLLIELQSWLKTIN